MLRKEGVTESPRGGGGVGDAEGRGGHIFPSGVEQV